MTDPPPFFTVVMRCFSLYVSLFLRKHADAVPDKIVQFWSHLTRAPCFRHNVNDIWKTPSAFFCVLWSEKALFWQPFQWGCGWWCFLKPGDPKTPSRPAIISLRLLGILLLLSPFSSVSWGARCSCIIYPWGFQLFCFLHGVGWSSGILHVCYIIFIPRWNRSSLTHR